MDKERIAACVLITLMVAGAPFVLGFGLVFLGAMFMKGITVALAVFGV